MKLIIPERAGLQTNLGLLSLQGLLEKQGVLRDGGLYFFLSKLSSRAAAPAFKPSPTPGLNTISFLFSFSSLLATSDTFTVGTFFIYLHMLIWIWMENLSQHQGAVATKEMSLISRWCNNTNLADLVRNVLCTQNIVTNTPLTGHQLQYALLTASDGSRLPQIFFTKCIYSG